MLSLLENRYPEIYNYLELPKGIGPELIDETTANGSGYIGYRYTNLLINAARALKE